MDEREKRDREMLKFVPLATEQMRRNLARAEELVSGLVGEYVASGKHDVCIVASGSSFNAAMCARNYMQRVLSARVEVVSPEAYLKYEAVPLSDSFTFVTSQSGSSTNIIAALDWMGANGSRRVSCTGNMASDIVAHSDVTFDYAPGAETCGYVTMGVDTFALFCELFAVYAAQATGVLDAAATDTALVDIANMIDVHEATVAKMDAFVRANEPLLAHHFPVLIAGTGPSYGAALEGTIKFMEVAKCPCLPCEFEEFLHGPDYQLTPDYIVFLIGFDVPRMQQDTVYAGVSKVTQSTFLISPSVDADDPRQLGIEDLADQLLAGIPLLGVFQYITAYVAEQTGRWPNHPYFQQVWWRELNAKTADYDEVCGIAAASKNE